MDGNGWVMRAWAVVRGCGSVPTGRCGSVRTGGCGCVGVSRRGGADPPVDLYVLRAVAAGLSGQSTAPTTGSPLSSCICTSTGLWRHAAAQAGAATPTAA